MTANPSSKGSLDQQRAAYAWKKVQDTRDGFDEYVNLARGAPALVMSNGLMQTLAFFESKKKHHAVLSAHICEWMKSRGLCPGALFKDVMESLLTAPSERYMWATEETLELLRWIKHFAGAKKAGKKAPRAFPRRN